MVVTKCNQKFKKKQTTKGGSTHVTQQRRKTDPEE